MNIYHDIVFLFFDLMYIMFAILAMRAVWDLTFDYIKSNARKDM